MPDERHDVISWKSDEALDRGAIAAPTLPGPCDTKPTELSRLPAREVFSAPSERSRVISVILAATAARIVLGASVGLGVDESYAVALSRKLSVSYFDHPPLAFWLAALAVRVFGTRHDLLLRLPFIALFAGTTWLLYRLTARLYGERAGLYAAVLVSVIPVFAVADGGWILPDGPLLFGLAGAALALSHIVRPSHGDDMASWWLVAAVFTGIAALSKYHAGLFVAGAVLYFASSPRHRRWLARPAPYVAAALVIAIGLPVLLWNAAHAWASFRFQSGRAGPHLAPHVLPVLQNLAGQAGYTLPWIWLPLAWLFASALWRRRRARSSWLLVCLGAGPIVVFTAASVVGDPGRPHWPAPGWFLLLPLLADALARLERRGRSRFVRGYLGLSAAVVIGAAAVASSQVTTGWVSRRVPQWFTHGDPSLDLVDWRDARTALEEESRVDGERMFVAANWIDAAKLGAALPYGSTVVCFSDDPRHFAFAFDQQAAVGEDALVVLRTGRRSDFASARSRIAENFRSLDSLTTLDIHRRGSGETVVELVVYRGRTLLHPYASTGDR